jgi:hypothetical protein
MNYSNQSRASISRAAAVLTVALVVLLGTLAFTYALAFAPNSPLKVMDTASNLPGSTETTTVVVNSTVVVQHQPSNVSVSVVVTSLSTVNLTSVETRNYTTTRSFNVTRTVTLTNSSALSALSGSLSQMSQSYSSLQSSASSYESQLSSLSSAVSSASASVSSLLGLLNLSSSAVEGSNLTVSEGAGQVMPVLTFVASYPGYIVVSGSSSTTNGYIQVSDTYPGYPTVSNVPFGRRSTSVLIPVLPGTVTVSFGNTNLINSASAIISVTYFY